MVYCAYSTDQNEFSKWCDWNLLLTLMLLVANLANAK